MPRLLWILVLLPLAPTAPGCGSSSEEATFTVPGPDGRGIPPGKYRVSVTQKLKREAVD